MITAHTERRSRLWFLLPIFLGLIGGIIAYFVLRGDDPKLAKNCLYLSIAIMAVGLVFNAVASTMVPEYGPGFRVGI